MVRIAFSGKMTAGKTTISDMLCEKYDNWARMAIGDEIKLISKHMLYDLDALRKKMGHLDNFDEYLIDVKKLNKEFEGEKFEFDEDGNFVKNKVYRPYIQRVGRLARDYFGEGVWVDVYLENASKKGPVVCDDVRTEYEYDVMKNKKVVFIRLEIDPEKQRERILNLYGSIDEESLTHISETALDEKKFDLVLDTTEDTVEETFKKVEDYLVKQGII